MGEISRPGINSIKMWLTQRLKSPPEILQAFAFAPQVRTETSQDPQRKKGRGYAWGPNLSHKDVSALKIME